MEKTVLVEKNVREDSAYLLTINESFAKGPMVVSKAHIHDDIEIVYILCGSFDVFLNGVMYSVSKGDLIIINAREVHRIVAKSEDKSSYIWMRFAAEMVYSVEQSLFEIKYVLPFLMSDSTHDKVLREETIRNSGIVDSIIQIYDEYYTRSYGFELAIKINVCKIFLWILRFWNVNGVNLNIDENKNGKAALDLSRVFSYVSENFSENITVDDMAKLCCMSYSYFSRIFKEVTGQTFSEYLNFIRIREAQRLLATTDMTITEIAYNTGFSSSSHFVSRFREKMGLTPKHFRNNFER